VVSKLQQRAWTNRKARNHLSSLRSVPMQLCALVTHIRISRNLKKFVHLMRNHSSDPEPSPCPFQAQARGQNISESLIVGCTGSACFLQDTVIGMQDFWRQLSANSSIVARRTGKPTSFLRPVVATAALLSATAIFWSLAMGMEPLSWLIRWFTAQCPQKLSLLAGDPCSLSTAVHSTCCRPEFLIQFSGGFETHFHGGHYSTSLRGHTRWTSPSPALTERRPHPHFS